MNATIRTFSRAASAALMALAFAGAAHAQDGPSASEGSDTTRAAQSTDTSPRAPRRARTPARVGW